MTFTVLTDSSELLALGVSGSMDRKLSLVALILILGGLYYERRMEEYYIWTALALTGGWVTIWTALLVIWLKFHLENFLLDAMAHQMLRWVFFFLPPPPFPF